MTTYILKCTTQEKGSSVRVLDSSLSLEEVQAVFERIERDRVGEHTIVYTLEDWCLANQYKNFEVDRYAYRALIAKDEADFQTLADEEYAGLRYPEYPDP